MKVRGIFKPITKWYHNFLPACLFTDLYIYFDKPYYLSKIKIIKDERSLKK